jgi:hypothetical protein
MADILELQLIAFLHLPWSEVIAESGMGCIVSNRHKLIHSVDVSEV